MSVALPPPLPPLDVPRAQLGSDMPVREVSGFRLHLPAEPRLDADRLQAAVAGARDVDEAVHGLAQAYYEEGLLSAQLVYAVDGDDVYVGLRPHAIRAVHAPAPLLPYFEPLLGSEPLRAEALEPRRALANVHAERAGLTTHTQLKPVEGGEGYALDIDQVGSRAEPNALTAELWNPGNRFVGRDFFDLDLSHRNIVGDQFRLLWHTALTGLGDARAQSYNEETVTWSRATTAGVFGLTGHFYDFETEAEIRGRLREAQLAWLYPLAGGLRSRWLVEARADYTNRVREGRLDPQSELRLAQREEYPSLQLGTHYSFSGGWWGRPLDVDLGLTARQGMRGETSTSGAALDYWLVRPSLNVNLALNDAFDSGLVVAGQYTDEALPEESQWVLGGMDNVIAYLPGIAVGDSGAYVMTDLQYDGWDLAGLQLQPRAFAEYGYSRYARGDDRAVQLVDVGAELALLWRHFEARLAAALPVQHTGVDERIRRDSEANLLFRISASF